MRLIDADALKDYISDRVKAQKGKNRDLIPVGELPIVIDKQPTIFNLDRIVEQINELRRECEDPLQDYCPEYFIDRAIEIVEAGGNILVDEKEMSELIGIEECRNLRQVINTLTCAPLLTQKEYISFIAVANRVLNRMEREEV